jgi:hypothetical protein
MTVHSSMLVTTPLGPMVVRLENGRVCDGLLRGRDWPWYVATLEKRFPGEVKWEELTGGNDDGVV